MKKKKEKIIIKTHEEAERERERFEDEATCPHCGHRAITAILHEEREGGLLFGKTVYYSEYHCIECGTEWRVRKD